LTLIHFRKISLFLLFVLLGLGISSCSQSNPSKIEIEEAWQTSAHSKWIVEETPANPTTCSKCHNALGYQRFLGVESTTLISIEVSANADTMARCQVCHNETAATKNFANMPSGLKMINLGQEANCIECHQGVASALQVAETITNLPKDQVNTDLTMPNLHAGAAGATFHGTQAKGGAEYSQYQYSSKFDHFTDTCITCHDSHTLDVRTDRCGACHLGATSLEGVRNIRLSRIDFDGDGNIAEGLADEIETMMEKLWFTMQLYAALTDDADSIVYEDGRFLDQAGETYTTWTSELLQAAYNYNYAAKDPGSYSHHPKYIMQLLFDSIDELGGSTRGMTRPTME
jgi:nitrate/TMAO reductase-like tetraheme cytochrome c subunit